MNGQQIIDGIRQRCKANGYAIADDAKVGVVSSFGQGVTVNDQTRSLWAIATTDAIDCESEVVVPKGADTSYFMANKALFVDHQYNFQSAVGAVRSLSPFPSADSPRGWKLHAYILKLESSSIGNDILTFAREVGIGLSIGFEAVEAGRPNDEEVKAYTRNGVQPKSVVRKWRWLETSFTALPCNVECQTLSIRTDDTRADSIERMLVKGLVGKESAAILGFPVKERRRVIRCRV